MITTLQRDKLSQMLSRVQHLQLFGAGPDGKPIGEHLAADLQGMLANDGEARKRAVEFGKLVQRAHHGDLEARQQLCALVIERVQNYVVATMNFGRFFETRTLADNESPAIQNNTRQEIKAGYIAQDGSPTMTKVIKPQSETLVDLHELVSDVVTYRIRDIYTGNVEEAARATFDIAFDLKNQLESILYTLLIANVTAGGALGAFDITAANKANRVYNTHSRLLPGVLPTSNDLQVAGIGGNTKFGFPALDEIIDYCVRFAGTDSGGDLRPTGELIVPAQDVREIATGITPTGTKSTDLAESVLRTGWLDVGPYMGYNWRVVPDNTIPRKALFAVLNRPVGILWFKPGMAEVEETVNKMKNQASRQEKQVIAMAIPTPSRKNIVRVTYRS